MRTMQHNDPSARGRSGLTATGAAPGTAHPTGPVRALPAQGHVEPAPPSGPPAVQVRGLTRIYEVPGRGDARVQALNGVDVDLPAGTFTAIVGASGSGKSTMLHCMAGLDQPTTGRITLLGTALADLRPAERAAFRARHVGFVFQDYNLIASLSAAENVSMPARLAGARVERTQALAALARVGLEHRADLKPHQLSGGERQRVAIARVMASRPSLVFADEPTGALDLESGGVVLDWLGQLARQGATVVMVTHDVEAASRADAVAVMSRGRLAGWSDSRDARRIAELVHASRS
ncbi:ABC transporter ATP-binding protein [Actinomyces capricornis]|uniref:ABC transporter ATP-binding protein n=1 Tax=Actinomyces capricornis TaxID=2755559 RepID=UPI001CC77F58|nr:ABC transporter ATP-binding protein [Actinomyces capricornis]